MRAHHLHAPLTRYEVAAHCDSNRAGRVARQEREARPEGSATRRGLEVPRRLAPLAGDVRRRPSAGREVQEGGAGGRCGGGRATRAHAPRATVAARIGRAASRVARPRGGGGPGAALARRGGAARRSRPTPPVFVGYLGWRGARGSRTRQRWDAALGTAAALPERRGSRKMPNAAVGGGLVRAGAMPPSPAVAVVSTPWRRLLQAAAVIASRLMSRASAGGLARGRRLVRHRSATRRCACSPYRLGVRIGLATLRVRNADQSLHQESASRNYKPPGILTTVFVGKKSPDLVLG